MSENAFIEGQTGPWEVVIGLEVHAQVVSDAKLFSGASTEFGAEPNAQVSLIDAAMPGMLPVINEVCVAQAVRTGLALNAEINLMSVFDRKNYFYPDLPAGYQISQYTRPIVGAGEITIELDDGARRQIGITRLHLEQDAGKSVHDRHPSKTYVDLNRSGVALMEIVSEPDLRSAAEAGAYMRKMRSILRYIGTCDGNMEEGSLRCDANVSVRHPGDDLGTRCEIKNLNSVRFIMRAIEHEARRQIEIIEDGGTIAQETRLYDPDRDETRSMRSKEEAHDYRYFPDPDLVPLQFEQAWVDELQAALPELPDAKRERLIADYGLSDYNASVLVAEKEVAAFYEETVAALGADGAAAGTDAANLILTDLFGRLNKAGQSIDESPISPKGVAGLLKLKIDDVISGRIAKDVFEIMFETGQDPAEIVEERGLKQVTDTGEIDAQIDAVLAANTDKVADYKAGKTKLLGFFMGQIMQASQGKANPKLVNDALRKKLDG